MIETMTMIRTLDFWTRKVEHNPKGVVKGAVVVEGHVLHVVVPQHAAHAEQSLHVVLKVHVEAKQRVLRKEVWETIFRLQLVNQVHQGCPVGQIKTPKTLLVI